MTITRAQHLIAIALMCVLAATTIAHAAGPSTALGAGPLPSWNDGAAKQSIVEFVAKVTKESCGISCGGCYLAD